MHCYDERSSGPNPVPKQPAVKTPSSRDGNCGASVLSKVSKLTLEKNLDFS